MAKNIKEEAVIFSLGERKVKFVGEDHFIADNAVVIGTVVMENNSSIWFNVVARGDNDVLTVGENSNVQDGSVLHTDRGVKLTIGKNVSVGHLVMLHGCTIGDNSLIGINSVILNHAVIGKNCIIGANALIPEGRVIPDNSVVLGSPGKVMRHVNADEIAMIKWNADDYVKNFKHFKKQLKPDPR
ncbi:MAG TPA: gamma carbonic anhydrase family protein [Burkholderiales bacterium]|nr:gamma carbonic anhydrase family protein [Burkholderiales bacterium]